MQLFAINLTRLSAQSRYQFWTVEAITERARSGQAVYEMRTNKRVMHYTRYRTTGIARPLVMEC